MEWEWKDGWGGMEDGMEGWNGRMEWKDGIEEGNGTHRALNDFYR